MNESTKILVTGASGLIGGHVVRYFAGKGLPVYCLVRETSRRDFISDLPVSFITGDITHLDSLVEACQGMQYIIHTAALTTDWGRRDDFHQVNVAGTINVLRAAHLNNIKDVIITGSVSSYGEEDSQVLKSENSPFNSHYPYFMHKIFPSGMNYYRDSKAQATIEATLFAEKYAINLSIIEPVWVYGENEFSSGFFEYLSAVKSGMKFMPGSGKNNFHVIYAGDLAEAYYHVFQKRPEGINRFIIGNRAPEKMEHIFSLFCSEAGLRYPTKLPKPLIYPVAFLVELAAFMFKVKKAPLISRARVNMFYDNIGFDTGKAEEILSFRASTPLETGIRKTVEWYKQHQYL